MDASKRMVQVSVEDYLEGEKDAAVKHEYVRGEVFALAGASDVHNTIAGNIHTVLNLAARRTDCRVYASDIKVRVGENFYYPDVMFVCKDGPDAFYKDKPCVVAEVVSRSTLRIDIAEKCYTYLELPSLKLYLLGRQPPPVRVGLLPDENGLGRAIFTEGESVPVPCAEVELTMEDIYVQTPYL